MTVAGNAQGLPRGDAAERSQQGVGRRREDRLVGSSRATRDLIDQVTAAARSDLPVIVTGPPGAGKLFVARAVHNWSNRGTGPFSVVACGATPAGLQAREFFGCARDVHAKLPEAYDGALQRAARGTLVVKDIERLDLVTRRALVEAITERSYRREGESTRSPLEARIVFSSEAPLDDDLLGGLPHHEIRVPSLAERQEDIPALAAHFLASFAEELGQRAVGFTAEARERLLAGPWPGNVRELRERIRQAVRLAGGGALTGEALLLAEDSEEIPSFKEAKRAFETRYVEGLLRRCDGNISRAARLAKKDRKDFYDVIRRTGVDPSQFRS
jgi:two-component system response regulator GlrR